MDINKNSNIFLLLILSFIGLLISNKLGTDLFKNQEQKLSAGFKFLGLFAMYEAIFGTNINGLMDKPKKLENFLKHPIIKLITLFFISFGVTQQIEKSLFITPIFLLIIHLLRSDEERKKHPYLI